MNTKNIFLLLVSVSIACFNSNAMQQAEPLSLVDRQLMFAAREGNLERINELLKAGARIDIPGAMATALDEAVKYNQLPAVKLLIQKKANINAREGTYGFTPLMISAQQPDKLPLLLELLNLGALVNMPAKNTGYTALHYAAAYNQPNAIIALLAANANPLLTTDNRFAPVKNATPLDLATKAGFKNAQVILSNLALSPEEIKYIATGMIATREQFPEKRIRDLEDIVFAELVRDVAQKKMTKIESELSPEVWETLDRKLLLKALEINVKRGFGLREN